MSTPNALLGPRWREDLIEDRKRTMRKEKRRDFAPLDGTCFRCAADLVTFHGQAYASADVGHCPFCHVSYTE